MTVKDIKSNNLYSPDAAILNKLLIFTKMKMTVYL